MNDHDAFRELSALRLYGEIDATERARLDAHLAACPACAAFARELDDGLGRLLHDHAADEVPPGWAARVAAEAHGEAWRRRALPWIAAAAGFALGVATMALVPAGRASPDAHAPAVAQADARPAPGGPVPRSTAGPGPLTRLATHRR
jgi:anti-sigma factor RsiW